MEQSDRFRMILEKHYGIHLSSGTVAATRPTSYGHAAVGGYMYVVFEMKGWNGNGDSEVQASLYTLEALRPPIRKEKDPLDLLPCIIVYCVGGCLSLPCYPLLTPHRHGLIGFSGTVLTDRFQLEGLTECYIFHTNVPAFWSRRMAVTTH